MAYTSNDKKIQSWLEEKVINRKPALADYLHLADALADVVTYSRQNYDYYDERNILAAISVALRPGLNEKAGADQLRSKIRDALSVCRTFPSVENKEAMIDAIKAVVDYGQGNIQPRHAQDLFAEVRKALHGS